jgi:hypothetical protein
MHKDTKFYMTEPFFIGWSILTLTGAALAYFVLPARLFSIAAALLILLSVLLILRIVQLIYKRIESKRHDYAQIESLFSLYHHLQPGVHLPTMRNHAGSPDFLNLIVEMLARYRPKVIVEASSGISSIVISEWLLQNAPDSKHYALEDELKYAELTHARIRNPNSRILHAPIREYTIDGESWKYYDLEKLAEVDQIDLIIVDGPPWRLQPLARYPALPLLRDKLADKYVVILDDAIREEEQKIAARWKKELPLHVEHRPLEKGAFIFTSSSADNS